jgi:ADP-ribose pyrophosphatase
VIDPKQFEENTLATTTEFSGRLLTLRMDTVELPDGGRATREVVEHPGAVALVPLTSDGEVVLVYQWRHPAGRLSLEIPAGTLEPGEPPEECARRELVEETGYYPGELERLVDFHVSPGYSDEIIHLFLASELQVQGDSSFPQAAAAWVPDPDEKLQAVTRTLQEAVELCLAGEIFDAKTIAGILLAARR